MNRTLLMCLLLVPLSAASTPPGAEQDARMHQVLTKVVAALLEHQHLTGREVDDNLSADWYDAFIDTWDPQRMYFLQEDIDELAQLRSNLDDTVRGHARADLRPLWVIWERYALRANERLTHAVWLLDQPVDFTVEESWDYDREDADWATTRAELDELWRKRVKDQRLRGELWDVEAQQRVDDLRERYEDQRKSIASMEAMDVLESYLSALASVHDPHSTYLKPASRDNFEIDLESEVEGIGAVLRVRRQYTTIESLVAGGPAEASGALKPGDKIIAVAQGARGEPVDVVGQRIDKVVKLIRGKKGTIVRLTIIPADDPTITREIPIERDKVKLEEALVKDQVRDLKTGDDKALRVGIIDVPSFYAPMRGDDGARVSTDVRAALERHREQGVEAVVLDLRTNSGGSLTEAVKLTGLFIDKGPVLQVRDRRGQVSPYYDEDRGTAWDGPLVVLTGQGSASASEIFAAAIQDYGRGIVAGATTTHGKGTVQYINQLDQQLMGIVPGLQRGEAGMLKLTAQQFYRVNGGTVQSRGVEADIHIPNLYETTHTYEKDYPFAIGWNAVDPVPVNRLADVDPIRDLVVTRSQERIAADELLSNIVEANERALEYQDRTSISLNLEQRKSDLDTDAQPEEDEAADDAETSAERPDPVLEEAIRIARDLATLG